MSLDRMPSVKSVTKPEEAKADDLEITIEDLLQEFPEENRERIEQRIESLPLPEQVTFLENGLRKRRETLLVPPYRSEHLKMIGRVPGSIFDHAFDHKDAVEVGRGSNGLVFEYKSQEQDDEGITVVYKMLTRPPANFQNDLITEGAYQTDVAAFAEQQEDLRVRVPQPFFIASSQRGYVLAMEKLPGYSVEDIYKKGVRLPRDFDYALVQHEIEEFVRRMNAAGFYHRDLRPGNIMINPDAAPEKPVAYIIDFGVCTKASSEQEAYQELDGLRDYGMVEKVMAQLRRHQER